MKPLLLILHVFSALIQLLFFVLLSQRIRAYLIQLWSSQLLKILKIKVVVHGDQNFIDGHYSYLMASNHISWLDIHVINTIKPVVFVAKADVANWPIFGWIAKMIGTIFVKREKLSDLKRVIKEIKLKLQEQQTVCIFPEGTSSDGRQILEFRSNLFEAVAGSEIKILPIALSYQEDQKYSDRTAFIGEMGLIDSIKLIMQSDQIEAHIEVCALQKAQNSRQNTAAVVRQAILGTSRFGGYN
jgi:1-acyl-sn-glycerol-3-phosphate acyltransferase